MVCSISNGVGEHLCGNSTEPSWLLFRGKIALFGCDDVLGATYLDENSVEQSFWMGSYGIEPARAAPAIAEQCYDERGLIWPASVAPYDVWITPIGEAALAFADTLHRELSSAGLAVVVDDRDLSPDVRFAGADLIGVPLRVTIGKRLEKDGVITIKRRGGADVENVPSGEAAATLIVHAR